MRKEMIAIMVVSAMMLTMTGIAAAEDDPIIIHGTITDANGDPVNGISVEILKNNGGNWDSMGGAVNTNSVGNYNTFDLHLDATQTRNDSYRMKVGGNLVDERRIEGNDWICGFPNQPGCLFTYSYRWNYSIPEFSTIAIPVISVIGLLFVFQNKKKKA